MQTRIQKWANSLGLRIPRSFAAEAQVEEGTTVDLSVEDGRLLVRPHRVRKYALSALLRKVSLGSCMARSRRVKRAAARLGRDLIWLQFNRQAGHEQAGHRPALVISPSSYNRRVGLAVCCPVTSGMRRMTGYSRGARLGPDDEPPRGLPPGRPVTEGGVYDSAR